jgi:hypothetical protein
VRLVKSSLTVICYPTLARGEGPGPHWPQLYRPADRRKITAPGYAGSMMLNTPLDTVTRVCMVVL